jgi:hypothetical protein
MAVAQIAATAILKTALAICLMNLPMALKNFLKPQPRKQ